MLRKIGNFNGLEMMVDSSVREKRESAIGDYFNNFGLLSSLNDKEAMFLLMEMIAKGKVKLYSEYCKEKNIEIDKDKDDNLVKSLDSLVSQAIELAKSENKNLEDFRIKIFEILFFKKDTRENLKAFCVKDEKLREKFEELEIEELKN